ncbi:MAG: hypothetical protein ABUL69_02055, partial [Peristeroidobacter soli]
IGSASCLPAAAQQDAQQAPAADAATRPRISVEAGMGQTDNLFHDTTNLRSDISTLGLRLNVGADRPRLQGRFATNLEGRKYGAGSVADDSEVVGSLDGGLQVKIVPDRFAWTFEQNYGQTRIDPLAPVGPENRDRTSIFSTGPQLVVPIGERNEFLLNGRVSNRDYQRLTQLNSDLTTTTIAYTHRADAATRLSVALDERVSKYDLSNDEFDFRTLSFTYSRALASGDIEAELGHGEVQVQQRWESTAIGQIAWNRHLGARSKINATVSRQLTDAGELFRIGGFAGNGGDILTGFSTSVDLNADRLQGIVPVPDLVTRSDAGVRLELVSHLTTMTFAANIARDEFLESKAFNDDLKLFLINLNRPIGRLWAGTITLSKTSQEFSQTSVRN